MTTATTPVASTATVTTAQQQRLAAFCSATAAEVFHSIVYQPQIWVPDPFDVETIHEDAREVFERLLNRAATATPTFGKILLLLGESGSGKTHLMRAFRSRTHETTRGYCAYLQMTTQTDNYARYLLANLVDSLDQPYQDPKGTSGLMRLSPGLLEAVPGLSGEDRLRYREGDVEDLSAAVNEYADRITSEGRFLSLDLDLVRALLYLQRNDPRLRNRVLKWLRCEDLSSPDRAFLGGLVPRTLEEAPLRMVTQIGTLMSAVQGAALVLCVDQLEDMFNQSEPAGRFRKVIDVLVAVMDTVPSSVVVLACLEDYFTANQQMLTMPKLDRLTRDPEPIRLKGYLTQEEVESLVEHRLSVLYAEAEVPEDGENSTFPFKKEHLLPLTNLRTREVLDFCRRHQQRCIKLGTWFDPEAKTPTPTPGTVPPPARTAIRPLEQAWNDFHTGFRAEVPEDEDELAALLCWATLQCSRELPEGYHFGCDPQGRMLAVEFHGPGNAVDKLLVAVCEKGSQGGGLGKQIAEVAKRAGENPVVLVRSSAFPTNPKVDVSKQIGKLLSAGGRRVVVEDADWRTLLALKAFHTQHGTTESYAAWQCECRPLSRLASLRQILALDSLLSQPAAPIRDSTAPPPPSVTPPPTPPAPPPTAPTPALTDALFLGMSRGLSPNPVTMGAEELKQHAAFLGGSGSGKTTAALNVIEQLLLRGIPAVLLDRKGDLAVYADPGAWERSLGDLAQVAQRQELRAKLDVAVFTPGCADGRSLTIAISPPGMDRLPTAEREEMAALAGSSLGGMLGFKSRGPDQSRLAVLRKAIEVLNAIPGQNVTLPALRELVGGMDEALLNAIGGGYEKRVYKKLAEELLTLELNQSQLLSGSAEPLDVDALLGMGPHARPGRVRLSIISTKFLRDQATTDFWVAQMLLAIGRWTSKAPSARLQAVFLFDEADQYLPATRQPATKAPMENLLKRARSGGVGVLLATQSPGDFDYKCRDTIRSWMVGRVKEQPALNKLKPMLSECKPDVTGKLASLGTGEFYLIREGAVCSLKSSPSLLVADQLSEDQILGLARTSRSMARA